MDMKSLRGFSKATVCRVRSEEEITSAYACASHRKSKSSLYGDEYP